MCSEQACGKAIAKASEYKSSTFLYSINPIFYLVAYLSAHPHPYLYFLSWPFSITLRRVSSCQSLLSSRFLLPPPSLSAVSLPPSISRLHSSPLPLPSSSHLSSLKLTVPEERGHLRTKWRISRQLCAHSLRWPSIIHSLLPPPFSLSPSSLCPFHLSPPSPPLPLCCFFTPRLRVRLPLSIPVIPSFKPFLFLFLLSPSSNNPLLDAFNTLAYSSDHRSTIFTPTASAEQLLTSTSLTYCFFLLCLPMSPSFSCVSPKIDDSPPQGEWACLKMHEVMRPSFLLSLLSSPPNSAATSARGFPPIPGSQRPPPNQTAFSPLPALVRTAECDVWRSAGRQCDKWHCWGPAT